MSTNLIQLDKASLDLNVLESWGKVRRQLNRITTQKLKPIGLGTKQAIIIHHLSRYKVACLKDLSRATITDPAATSRAIDSLIKKGWVHQADHPEDRRRWQVSLSQQGAELSKQISSTFSEIAETFCSPLAKEEKNILLSLLLKIHSHLDSQTPEG